MSNVVIGHRNYSDVGVLHSPVLSPTLGSWSAGLPLPNAQDGELDTVARSTNAAVASTQFSADLGASRATRLLSLWKHNLSSAGKVRARAYSALPVAVKLDVADATAIVTPIRTAASYNANGVILDKLQDDNVSAAEGYKWDAGWTGDGQKIVEFEIRKDTSTSSVLRVRDVTAGANRALGVVTWSGTVATYTPTTGTHVSTTLIADGVYRIVVLTTSVTAASDNEIEFYPATDAALAIASTGLVYAGNFAWFNAATDQLIYDSLFSAAYPAGLTAEDVAGMNLGWTHITPTAQSARYWVFNVWDTGNAAGYVQFALLFMMAAWQPTVNMAEGSQIGIEDYSRRSVTEGGAAKFAVRGKPRVLRFSLDEQAETEALEQGFDPQRLKGTHQLFFVVYDPADTTHMHRRAFPCRLSRPSSFAHAFARYSAPLEFTEAL